MSVGMIAEIDRLRSTIAALEISAASRLERVIRLTAQNRELMAALDKVAPIKARELAREFEKERCAPLSKQ